MNRGDRREAVAPFLTDDDSSGPQATTNGMGFKERSGVLTRVDDDRTTHELRFSVPSGRVQVPAVPPGHYYVSQVHGGELDFQFTAQQSAFEAVAGQLSYPGEWTFRAIVFGDATHDLANNKYLQYKADLVVSDEHDTTPPARLAAQYPKLSRQAKAVCTRIVFR